MPRNASGVYTLPQAPFVPQTVISSTAMNSDLSDIATALTQSLATTGVAAMTGQFKAATGAVTAPGMAFASDLDTGFYLAGTNQIGLAVGGILAVTFNSDLSVTYAGAASFAGLVTFGATIGITGNVSLTGNIVANGTGSNVLGGAGSITDIGLAGVVISTASVYVNRYLDIKEVGSIPGSAPADTLRLYITERIINAAAAVPVAKDENGYSYPLSPLATQCRLAKSGTSLLLTPYNGNLLTINGVPQSVPDAGVSLAASNSAAVFVYIYAFMTAANMTLEMSATAPVVQAGTGIVQKTGDSSRTLVGAAFTDTGGAWADTDGKLWTLSYYNRRTKASRTSITASTTLSASVNYTEINASMRNNFIAWASTDVRVQANYNAFASGIGGTGFTQIRDELNTAYESAAINAAGTGFGAMTGAAIVTDIAGVITEATTHYVALFGRVTTGVGTWVLGTARGETNSLYVYVEG